MMLGRLDRGAPEAQGRAGNCFCGRVPLSGYIILSCGLLRKECKKTGVINPNCLAAQNSTASPPAAKLLRISDSEASASSAHPAPASALQEHCASRPYCSAGTKPHPGV